MFETNRGALYFSTFAISAVFLNGYLKESIPLILVSAFLYFVLVIFPFFKKMEHWTFGDRRVARILLTSLGLFIFVPLGWSIISTEYPFVVILSSGLMSLVYFVARLIRKN